MRDFRSGVWVRDVLKDPGGGVEAFRFINVMKVSPDAGTTREWRIFEFDREYRLRSITTAESGAYAAGRGMDADECRRDAAAAARRGSGRADERGHAGDP